MSIILGKLAVMGDYKIESTLRIIEKYGIDVDNLWNSCVKILKRNIAKINKWEYIDIVYKNLIGYLYEVDNKEKLIEILGSELYTELSYSDRGLRGLEFGMLAVRGILLEYETARQNNKLQEFIIEGVEGLNAILIRQKPNVLKLSRTSISTTVDEIIQDGRVVAKISAWDSTRLITVNNIITINGKFEIYDYGNNKLKRFLGIEALDEVTRR